VRNIYRKIGQQLTAISGLGVIAITTLTVTTLLLGFKHIGWLQPLELMTLDLMVRSRPEQLPDDRLLIVGLTEDDITSRNRWPLSDEIVAELLAKLQTYEPSVIGVDLYRDIPYEPGLKKLTKQLQAPNVISIQNLGDEKTRGVPAPAVVPEEQIGFNDLVLDPDGKVRRTLLIAGSNLSFAWQIVSKHLQKDKIFPRNSEYSEEIIWGEGRFSPLNRNSGGYHGIDDRGYQILLDYRAENIARQVSLEDVLTGKVEPDWVKGKIVLIGSVAPSLRDLFFTPYSWITKEDIPKMPGVLVHAQMVSHLLDVIAGDRPLFSFWQESVETLWIISWVFIGACTAWNYRRPWVLIISYPSLILLVTVVGFTLFLNGIWVSVWTPLTGLLASGTMVFAYRSYQSQRQHNTVMRLLGQNTSPEIATALWNNRDQLINDGKLPGQRLIATLFFTDLQNFTTVAEKMPPESLMDWLNEYLGMLTQTVTEYRGIVNKFTGDGVMAAFGVPVASRTTQDIDRNAQDAVACALVIGDRLVAMNEKWQATGLPLCTMRVGIFTGPIVAGSLGSKDRLEYGLLGDTVNIASRLESCEKDRQPSDCRILIAEETLVHLKDRFQVENWGPLSLKGKHQTVNVYRVIGSKNDALLKSKREKSEKNSGSNSQPLPLDHKNLL